jgi:septal ring factor EnvC (AmiA/AmiB activator)
VTILKGRITELQAMPGRTDGAAQGSAEVEAALAEKNQELEKLKEALAEKDQEIARLKIAISTLVTK